MDVATITQLINGCGFPIFACCAMGYYIVWSRKNNTESRRYDYEQLKSAIENNTQTVDALKDAVSEMTRVMQEGQKND